MVATNCPICGYEHYVNRKTPGRDWCAACTNREYGTHFPLTDHDEWESGVSKAVIVRQEKVIDFKEGDGDMTEENKFEGMYLTIPFGRTYHIFGKDSRSLCGKAMMLFKDPNQCEPVKGTETYKKGQDCKECFKRAGLKIEEARHSE